MNRYRYGFNGKENDNEVNGEGNTIDFGARIYDSRLGRFMSGDPKEKEYPHSSGYSFAANNPIRLVDVNGEEPGDPIWVQGKPGDNLGTASSLGSLFKIGPFASPWELQAYNFAKAVNGELGSSKVRFEGNKMIETRVVRVTSDQSLFLQTMWEIKRAHGMTESDFTSDELVALQTYTFSSITDRSDLFSYNITATKLSQVIPMPMTLPTTIVIPPGTASVGGAVVVDNSKVAIDKANEPWVLMAHKLKKQRNGASTQGGAQATRHQKGQTHGNLNSTKGNKKNPNQKKGAENRGGKKK